MTGVFEEERNSNQSGAERLEDTSAAGSAAAVSSASGPEHIGLQGAGGHPNMASAPIPLVQQNLIVPPLSDLSNGGYPYTAAMSAARAVPRRSRKQSVPNQPDLTSSGQAASLPSFPARVAPTSSDLVEHAKEGATSDTPSVASPSDSIPVSAAPSPGVPQPNSAPSSGDHSSQVYESDRLTTEAVEVNSESNATSAQTASPEPSSEEIIRGYEPSYTSVEEGDSAAGIDGQRAVNTTVDSPQSSSERVSVASLRKKIESVAGAKDNALVNGGPGLLRPVPPSSLMLSKKEKPFAATENSASAASENSLQSADLVETGNLDGYSTDYTYLPLKDSAVTEVFTPEAEGNPGFDELVESPIADAEVPTPTEENTCLAPETGDGPGSDGFSEEITPVAPETADGPGESATDESSVLRAESAHRPEADNGADSDDHGVIDESTLAKIEAMNSMLLSDSKAAKIGINDFWGRVVSGSIGKHECEELGKHVRAGIPSSYIGAAWKHMAEIGKSDAPDHISLLAGNDLYYEGTIDRHLHMIHRSGQSLANPAGLFRVLKAYGIYDRPLGYAPNAAYVANSFLRFMSEEDAYHMLVMVMKTPGQFRLRDWSTGAGLEVVLFQLDKVMETCIPNIRNHLIGKGIRLDSYAIDWITSLFQIQAPVNLATRLLSFYLLEGQTFFFKAAIAALTAVEEALAHCTTAEELIAILQNPFVLDQCADHEALLKSALAVNVSERTLEQFAVEFEFRRLRHLDDLKLVRKQEEEREALNRARKQEEEREALRHAAEVKPPQLKAMMDVEEKPRRKSMIIPSGIYSLFTRGSKRRPETVNGQASPEAVSAVSRLSTGESANIADLMPDNHKAPTDRNLLTDRDSQTSSNATTVRSNSSSRLSVASLPSGTSTPRSSLQSLPGADSLPKESTGTQEVRRVELPSANKHSDEEESAVLAAYATKSAELAGELAEAQVAVFRERAAAAALRKQLTDLIENNVKLDVELQIAKKKLVTSEATRRKLELRWERVFNLVIED